MEKEKVLELVEKHLDMPGLVAEVLDEVLKPALDEMVKKSDNPYDDVAVAALYPALEPVLKEQVAKLWGKVDGK